MILGRKLVIAGVAGLACGKALSVARAHPSTAKSILSYTALSSVVGATLGVGVAYYRKVPLHVYGISVGANFALCSLTFFGVRHVLMWQFQQWRPHPLPSHEEEETALSDVLSWKQEYLCSICSGGVAGGLASILSRHGVGLVISTGVGGMVVGTLGQWSYYRFQHWRKKRAVVLQLAEPQAHREWTLNEFQEWFLGYWHRRSRILRVESEITLLESDIAREQQRIAELDRELAILEEKGGNGQGLAALEEGGGDGGTGQGH